VPLIGLVATPVLPARRAERLAADLADALSQRYPGLDWEVRPLRDGLVTPPARLTDLVDAARSRLLDHDWDLAVAVTELPLRLSRRPLLSHSSPTHGVALVSLPALGVRNVDRRLLESAADAVSILVGGAPEEAGDDATGDGIAFLARVVTGNLRLLGGMVRANRPWQLVVHLSRALAGALAAVIFSLLTSDVWRIATTVGGGRLAAIGGITLVAAVATLIIDHGLWERAPDRRVREQVALFNITTLLTVAFGMVSLYAGLLVVILAAAGLLIDPSLLGAAVGHEARLTDYLALSWLTASLATVGSILGGTLESESAVREAAYAHRPDEQRAHARPDSQGAADGASAGRPVHT
jgi:hypothetical protein